MAVREVSAKVIIDENGPLYKLYTFIGETEGFSLFPRGEW